MNIIDIIGRAIVITMIVLIPIAIGSIFYSLGKKHGYNKLKKETEEMFDFDWVDISDEEYEMLQAKRTKVDSN